MPTKDRPDDLKRMLTSLAVQSVKPAQVIIVDGSEHPVVDVVAGIEGLPLEYVRHFPPSLAAQRNAGMAALKPEIELAGYLDDDLVIERGAVEAMLDFWLGAGANVGGAAFNIIDHPPVRARRLKHLLLMSSSRPGAMLRSGFPSPIGTVAETTYTEWLSGGATVWRREVITAFAYDEWFLGTGYLEDVDYSYRVSRRYRLAVVADARVQHLTHPVPADRQFLVGRSQIINRVYLARKHTGLSVALCAWALLGTSSLNFGLSLLDRDRARLSRLRGNLAGVGSILRGRTDRLNGMFK